MAITNKFSLILMFAVLLLSIPGFAADRPAETAEDSEGAEVQAFCADPFHAVCGAHDELGQAYVDRSDAMSAQIRDQALRAVAAKYRYSPPNDAGYDEFARTHPQQSTAQFQDFLNAMRSGALTVVGEHRLDWQLGIENRIQAELVAVLDSGPAFTPEQRAAFKASFGQFQIVDVGQIIQNEKSDSDLFAKFIYQCGKSGLRDNAFQPPGSHFLVICPGMMMYSRMNASVPAYAQDMFPTLAWVFAHETGHMADVGSFPNELKAFQSCVDDEFGKTGQLEGLRGLSPGSPEYSAKLESYMEEITADTWANEVTARLVAQTSNRAQALGFVKATLVNLCRSQDDTKRHPSGEFRMSVLLGRNPRLRQALGCAPLASETPFCSWEGKVIRASEVR
jgi:hypothetical protein